MTEQRTADGAAAARPDRSLSARERAGRRAAARRAADRRRVRPPVLPRSSRRTARRSCWRCTPGRSTSRRCRSPTSATLLQQMPLPVPAHPRPFRRARHPRAAGSRRRHAAGAPRRGDRRPSTPRSTARRSRSSRCCSGAAPSSQSDGYLPYGIAFDVEKLTWELDFFVKHFLEAIAASRCPTAERDGARRGVGGDRRASWPPSRACSAIATITAAT